MPRMTPEEELVVQDENSDQEATRKGDDEAREQGLTLGRGGASVPVDPKNTEHMCVRQRRRGVDLTPEDAGRQFWRAVADLFLKEIGEQEAVQEPKVPGDIPAKEEDN